MRVIVFSLVRSLIFRTKWKKRGMMLNYTYDILFANRMSNLRKHILYAKRMSPSLKERQDAQLYLRYFANRVSPSLKV